MKIFINKNKSRENFEILPIKSTGQLSVIKMVYMQVKAKIK